MFTERAKTIALAIVHIFETAKPLGDYGAVAVLSDGAGLSVGINQFTHKSGSLADVIDRFVKLGGNLPAIIKNVLPDLRAGRNIEARSADSVLKNAIKSLGPDDKWRQAQREIAFENYLEPALKACEGSGFVHPLSLAVVYDSINQGGYPNVRNKVSASDHDEKAWIAEYCADRKAWLKSSKKSIVRTTVYRPNFFLGQIAKGNWELGLPLAVNGHQLTDAKLFGKVSATPTTSQRTSQLTADTEDNKVNPSTKPAGEALPISQNAETIVNTGDTTLPTPAPTDVTLEAPQSMGSVSGATKVTIAGITVPPLLLAAIDMLKNLIHDGYLDAKETGELVINLIRNNTKYILLGVGLVVVVIIVKKICREVIFLATVVSHMFPTLNNVQIVAPTPAEKPKYFWEFWN